MKSLRLWGILSLIGGITAVPLLVAFSMIEGGSVGTAAYQTYELLNRLMAVALLFMAAGWLGVGQIVKGYGRWAARSAFIGVLIMVLGTAAEFWLYSDLPYSGESMRQVAYSTASIGGWLHDLGSIALGIFIWRTRIWPRWRAVILLLALPIDIAAFFWLNSPFTAATVLALIVGSALTMKKETL